MSQAELQGIFKDRIEHINKFRRVMGDIRLSKHPFSQIIKLIFNDKVIDHYGDTTLTPTFTLDKLALVSKFNTYDYVQQAEFDSLVESDINQPYSVIITDTSLPRLPHADDIVVIAGYNYIISKVVLPNRLADTILTLLVYNEKSEILPDFDSSPDDYQEDSYQYNNYDDL